MSDKSYVDRYNGCRAHAQVASSTRKHIMQDQLRTHLSIRGRGRPRERDPHFRVSLELLRNSPPEHVQNLAKAAPDSGHAQHSQWPTRSKKFPTCQSTALRLIAI